MSTSTAAAPLHNANLSLSSNLHSRQDFRNRKAAVMDKKASETHYASGANRLLEDNMVISGEGQCHLVHGESVLSKSNEIAARMAYYKSTSTAAAISHKKIPHKKKTPKWLAYLGVLTRLLLLVSALLWSGQVIWKWRNGPTSFSASEIDDKLAELEGFKTVAKLLQIQLDVLDKKLKTEIGDTKMDIAWQVEDSNSNLEVRVKKLEGRTNKLDISVAELRESFVTKEDFDQFIAELRKSKGMDDTNGNDNISLDDIRDFAKEIVEKEITKHAADGLGKVDYALATAGAEVVKHSEPFLPGKNSIWLSSPKGRSWVNQNAQKLLKPSFGEPGQCFSLKGNSGFVEIKLRTAIIPTAVTLEHVHKSIAFDRTSAPKDCQITGWFVAPDDGGEKRSDTMITLAEFSYDLEKSNAQTFEVEGTVSQQINMVRLDFSSNHGSPSFTCIYRFRVHGGLPDSLDATSLPT